MTVEAMLFEFSVVIAILAFSALYSWLLTSILVAQAFNFERWDTASRAFCAALFLLFAVTISLVAQ